jgi:acyl carrier protein
MLPGARRTRADPRCDRETARTPERVDALIAELKAKIIAALRLEKVTPAEIRDDAPLFGVGLGLDSIDALELVALLEQDYGIVIQERAVADRAFASVRALAEFVANHRASCPNGTRS